MPLAPFCGVWMSMQGDGEHLKAFFHPYSPCCPLMLGYEEYFIEFVLLPLFFNVT